jgi:hypothetical protein
MIDNNDSDDSGESVECELAGETEVLGENPQQFHFVHHKSHVTWRGLEVGDCLSYDTALL